jgi:hypothetical protein
MTLRGRIEGGKIVLDEQVSLPEGAKVEVYVLKPRPTGPMQMNPELWKYVGMADDLPPDASKSIDRVLYGTPEE